MKTVYESPISRLPQVARELSRNGRRITCVHFEGAGMTVHVRGSRRLNPRNTRKDAN
jgi:hypothetical protein